MKKRSLILVLCLILVCSFAFAGCGEKKSVGKTLVVNVGPNPETIDPALNSAVDGATMISHFFTGLMQWSQDDKGNAVIVNGCAEKYEMSADGKTYTFTLRDGLKWSNGEELKASDFVWSWNRAVQPETGSAYGYMFDVIDGYEDAKLNAVADDAAKTITITLYNKCAYFLELTAFPTYMPVYKANVEANPDGWATKPETYVSNGPFTLTDWVQDSKIVASKNANWYDAANVKLDAIEFALSDDDTAILANFENGTYKFIDQVPVAEIPRLEKDYANEYVNAGQLGTYYWHFNMNLDLSPEGKTLTPQETAEVRKALSLLIDRQSMVKVLNGGQIPANSFVPIGLTAPTGGEFVDTNGVNRDGSGYFDVTDIDANRAEAMKVLAKYYDVKDGKCTNFPSIDALFNAGSEEVVELIQSDFAVAGITMTATVQEWQTFTATRRQGEYDFARNGWLGDYNDPNSFLDMWTSFSGNNDAQFGKGDNADVAIYGANGDQTWAEAYDSIVAEYKAEGDANTRFDLMHDAEDMLMSTGGLIPLYYYTNQYMMSEDIQGGFVSPLGYSFFIYADIADAE